MCAVWSEATITQQRVNAQTATEAVLIQAAILSALGGGKEFANMIKGLDRGHE